MTAKILIVDDEDNIRDAYKEFLADEGVMRSERWSGNEQLG